MKILLIDRDRTCIETVENICKGMMDIELVVETTKNTGMDRLKNENFDAVFVDPAPQNDELRAFVIGMRRVCEGHTSVIVLSHQFEKNDVAKFGANDLIKKPIDENAFKKIIDNIHHFSKFNAQLNNGKDDFRSADGVISKSAFHQIFLSCLDRADRYGEKTFLTFTRIENIDEIRTNHGDDIASQLCEKLKYFTTKTRRLSDIAGRTAEHEICLMLVRPMSEDEPNLAFDRLSESIEGCHNLIEINGVIPTVSVSMMAIPSGEIIHSKRFE